MSVVYVHSPLREAGPSSPLSTRTPFRRSLGGMDCNHSSRIDGDGAWRAYLASRYVACTATTPKSADAMRYLRDTLNQHPLLRYCLKYRDSAETIVSYLFNVRFWSRPSIANCRQRRPFGAPRFVCYNHSVRKQRDGKRTAGLSCRMA